MFSTEYVYSLQVSGSFGTSDICHCDHSSFLVSSQNVHCVHTSDQEYVICSQFEGLGNLHSFKWYNQTIVSILFKSVHLDAFLASLENHCSDIKAIVHNIASIVITTINSTKVKACFLYS